MCWAAARWRSSTTRPQLDRYLQRLAATLHGPSELVVSDKRPLLLDRYLSDAIEVDVDCLCDGKDTYVAGIMEHIEEAGIHSGDSACSLPPHSLSKRRPSPSWSGRPARWRSRSTSAG